ncbi:hypothetical protein BGZ98_001062 [Dissophora globulifera]|nr:hypothetical protein BGZ98_001062 [Dissophora globulifera]
MSHGACTNFCKSAGSAYALTSEGSLCRCSNSAPLDANKVDDSKCDKPCVGYPFEMCGGSSSNGLVNVLLIGSTANLSVANNGVSSGSDSGTGVSTTTGSKPGPSPDTDPSKSTDGGKGLSTKSPDDSNSSTGGTKAGAVAASIMAIFAFSVLFAIAVVFNRRRRRRLAQTAWTENMLLPSSLIHTSNDDELEGQDYTRATPIYHNSNNSSQQQQTANISGANPLPPMPGMHFPPPPALHPRQSGALHMHQPSYPPPPMMGLHYSNMRAPFQTFPIPSAMIGAHSSYEHANINHKEPVPSSPPSFTRAPQSLVMDDEDERSMRTLSHPSMRSIRPGRRGSIYRESMDSTTSGARMSHTEEGH